MPASTSRVLVLLASAAFCALACDTKPKGGAVASASASAEPAGLTPELAARVLAKVGDHEITLGEYAATLERMDPLERIRYQSADRRKELLNEIIDLQLLADEARRRGLDRQPETQERVRQMLRDELLAQVRSSAPAPDSFSEAEVRRYYDAHRDDFREPERRRVAHIALGSETEAKAVLEKALTATPAEWGKLVSEKSRDTRGKTGSPLAAELAGDLGIVGPPGHPRGENPNVPEPLRAAAFEIDKIGGVLPRAVAAGGQFHVLRLTGKTDARDRSYAEAERSIRVALVQDSIRAREAELDAELKRKYPVTIDDAQLAKIAVPALPSPAPSAKAPANP